MSLSLDEASKVVKGVEIRLDSEEYRWNGMMQIIRWVGAILWNQNAKKGRTKQPESLFRLPGDKKIKTPQATQQQVLKAVKKANLLKWQ